MKRRDLLQTSLGLAALWSTRRLLANTPSDALPDIHAKTLQGAMISLHRSDLRELAADTRGAVLVPNQPGYDDARRVWNGMFDKRPALIVRCASPSDVVRAVNFARSYELLTAVRAGGHSISGKSTCDGGIVIDVSPMHGVRVDPKKRLARVEGGALLGHLDRESLAFGLVTTAGTVSHTGAAGLTLGGGLGRVGRRFGLACDNLKSVDVVTADGRLLTANDDEHTDLFWALRGGGGNFGVATSFEYHLHPMSSMVLGGAVAWPMAQARNVLRFYAEFSLTAPDELCLDVAMVPTPEGARIVLEVCWSGNLSRGEHVIERVRSLGKPASDTIAPMPYLQLQSSADRRLAHGIRFYGKSGFVTTLTSEGIDRLIETFHSEPLGSFSIVLQHGGGAIARTPTSATAFPNRDANYWLMLSKSWTDAAEDTQRLQLLRRAWKPLEPLTSGLYVNGINDEERARIASNYGSNYARLQQIKRKYDSTNQFRLNANVPPAG